jgi:hypothetical protein
MSDAPEPKLVAHKDAWIALDLLAVALLLASLCIGRLYHVF